MIDRNKCRQINETLRQVLQDVENKHGVKITIGRGSFTTDTYNVKLEMAVNGVDTAKKDWDAYCFFYGLKSSDYGRKVQALDGEIYTICGIKPRGKKYPIVAKNARGMKYKLSANHLKFVD